MTAQPKWAVEPIVGCANAAKTIGVSRRYFMDIIKDKPEYYEPRGRSFVFYPEHIKLIREGLSKCQPTGNPSGTRKRKGGRSISRSKPSDFESALAFVTEASKTSPEPKQKPSTKPPGKVTSIR